MVAYELGLAVVLAVTYASTAAAEVKNIDRTLPLNANGTVALEAHNGSIEIRTWDRPEVEVHVRIEWLGLSASSYRYRETTVDVGGTADRVSIRWNSPDRYGWTFWSLFDGPWAYPEVRYTITTPKTARLDIRNHNARTDIRDVSASVRIGTHNGAVRVANLAGPLDLSMHNGWARVDYAAFSDATHIATHNGVVELALPATSRFNLDSHGHHMQVQSDFSVTSRASYSRWSSRGVSGSVNGGGPDLQVSAHNGSLRLHSK
jgi:DUF4097 and DUF4098 domain-containing protein YvlB